MVLAAHARSVSAGPDLPLGEGTFQISAVSVDGAAMPWAQRAAGLPDNVTKVGFHTRECSIWACVKAYGVNATADSARREATNDQTEILKIAEKDYQLCGRLISF